MYEYSVFINIVFQNIVPLLHIKARPLQGDFWVSYLRIQYFLMAAFDAVPPSYAIEDICVMYREVFLAAPRE